jgi:hypothetical protein
LATSPKSRLALLALLPLTFAGLILAISLWPGLGLARPQESQRPNMALSGLFPTPSPRSLRALGLAASEPRLWPVARPNPYDRGTCFQWKGCTGESIGAMPVDDPQFCGPLGGKSWKDFDGRCLDLKEGPRSSEPPEGLNRPK